MKNTNASRFINEIDEATKFAKLAIEQANVRNADNVDSKRTDKEFKEGDQVMLSTDNLFLKPGRIKKLFPKYIGPLTVVKKHANGLAYQLKMPLSLDQFMINSIYPC